MFLAVACVGFLFAATSCKKDCVCSWKGDNIPDAAKVEVNAGKMSKKDCENQTPSMTVAGATYSCVSQ